MKIDRMILLFDYTIKSSLKLISSSNEKIVYFCI